MFDPSTRQCPSAPELPSFSSCLFSPSLLSRSPCTRSELSASIPSLLIRPVGTPSPPTTPSMPSPPPCTRASPPLPPPQTTPPSSLLSLQISVPVYVKLVGSFSADAPSFLSSFASAALSSACFHIVGARPHHLAIGHTLHLDTFHSSLAPQISVAIQSHLDSATAPLYRSALVFVPYSIVD